MTALLTALALLTQPPLTWGELTARPVPQADTSFAYGPHASNRIDLYLPESGDAAVTAVILHGGCWLNQFDRRYMSHLARELASRGIAAAVAGYRRIGDEGGGWPGTGQDVALAFDHVARLPDVAGDRILVVGHSAGGHLALWLGGERDRIDAVAGLAAITDLSGYGSGDGSCNQAVARLGAAEALAGADPLRREPLDNLVLISGAQDGIVPPEYGARYALAASIPHHILEEAGHFDLVAPWTPAGRRVADLITDMAK